MSLHNRFMRVQNEGTGKSSWWMINPDAKPGKSARRRATSMETSKYEKKRGRVKKKVKCQTNSLVICCNVICESAVEWKEWILKKNGVTGRQAKHFIYWHFPPPQLNEYSLAMMREGADGWAHVSSRYADECDGSPLRLVCSRALTRT